MRKIAKNKGITLVILVITIVIMLILAGVSMNIAFGENGLITKSQKAKDETRMKIIQTEVLKWRENSILAHGAGEDTTYEVLLESFLTENLLANDYISADEKRLILEDEDKIVPLGIEDTEIDFTITFSVVNGGSGGNEGNEEKAGAPVLKGGVTPIKWDGVKWVDTTAGDSEWYEYRTQIGTTENGGTSKWANARTSNGSMLVWIPRYEYKITNGYHGYEGTTGSGTRLPSGTAGTIDVNLIPLSKIIPTEGYTIHPAFTNMGNNGLGELEGIWVGKFESSDDGNSNVKILPDVTSWKNMNISAMFEESQAFGSSNSLNGYDSHMMKNVEWGAVVYLAHSKYGRNGTAVTINNSSGYYTGRAGAIISDSVTSEGTYTYETTGGQLASTTGNIYGVYDMSGGSAEYVMGVYDSVIRASGFVSLPISKYFDNYTKYSNEIIGDAVYETSCNLTGTNSWFANHSGFVSLSIPWVVRGRLMP